MFCKNCGRQIPDNAASCPGCGTKQSDGEAYSDRRSSASIRNLPDYAKEIDRSGRAVDSDSDLKKFSFSDSGRSMFGLSNRNRKDDGDGIVRLTSSKEKAAQTKEPASGKESAGFANQRKDPGGTVFRSGDNSGTDASGPAKDETSAEKDATAANPAESGRPEPEQTAPEEPDARPEENEGRGGFVNPLRGTGDEIRWGSDGDRNQPAEDIGEIESPHLKFAVWMVILSCTCCNPVTLILGIIAIVFAFQVATCSRSGNLAIALQKAVVARVLCWITFGLLAAWISLLVAMLCLPMPEDKTSKQEVQTGKVEGESSTQEVQTEQTDSESSSQEVQTEQTDGGNVESVEPDIHHSPLNLLLDILD